MENDPQILSKSSSRKSRTSTDSSSSPEFEFWNVVRNPSSEQNLLPADELFVDGLILPLRLVSHRGSDDPPPDPGSDANDTVTTSEPVIGSDAIPNDNASAGLALASESGLGPLTASKRWKDIFKKKGDTKTTTCKKVEEKEAKKERKFSNAGGSGRVGSAELNINLWPFSRSRSAGTSAGSRPRVGVNTTRKVSSAPCSRSNSAGENKSRKWPSSPGRVGVHLGRPNPVFQVKRSGSGRNPNMHVPDPLVRNVEKMVKNEGLRKKPAAGDGVTRSKALSINVPVCIGYRQHLSCKSDGVVAGDGDGTIGDIAAGDEGRGNNLFSLRNLFTKKVY